MCWHEHRVKICAHSTLIAQDAVGQQASAVPQKNLHPGARNQQKYDTKLNTYLLRLYRALCTRNHGMLYVLARYCEWFWQFASKIHWLPNLRIFFKQKRKAFSTKSCVRHLRASKILPARLHQLCLLLSYWYREESQTHSLAPETRAYTHAQNHLSKLIGRLHTHCLDQQNPTWCPCLEAFSRMETVSRDPRTGARPLRAALGDSALVPAAPTPVLSPSTSDPFLMCCSELYFRSDIPHKRVYL